MKNLGGLTPNSFLKFYTRLFPVGQEHFKQETGRQTLPMSIDSSGMTAF